MKLRHAALAVAFLVSVGCADSDLVQQPETTQVDAVRAASSTTQTLTVTPRSFLIPLSIGATAPEGASTVSLTGNWAQSKKWTATKTKPWTTLIVASGKGSGTVKWRRNIAGLAAGLYIDTITVTALWAAGSPARIIDSLQIGGTSTPLAIAVTPASIAVQTTAGTAAPSGAAQIVLSGTGASTTTWTATKRKTWTSLGTSSGTGSGTLTWSRNTTTLAAGIYVDTITVSAVGASGSPARIIDTVRIVAAPTGTRPDLGRNGSLKGRRIFPATDPWNQPVDTAQVDANSLAILTKIGLTKNLHPDFGANWNGGPFGIPYVVVPDTQPRLPVSFMYAGESDPGPYPIPPNPPTEPAGDRHVLMVTQDEFKLYELFSVNSGAPWTAGSGAIFDMINGTTRPAGWTSADAAGLPILPGLVRYDEVAEQGAINHALRFTVRYTRRAYVAPARHWASTSTDPLNPPMGMRVRLKASVDISSYPAQAQVILRALKKYGMMVADNGSDFYLSGTADARWNDAVISTLKQIKVSDFEVVKMTNIVTN
jgi:hypothetical protein